MQHHCRREICLCFRGNGLYSCLLEAKKVGMLVIKRQPYWPKGPLNWPVTELWATIVYGVILIIGTAEVWLATEL